MKTNLERRDHWTSTMVPLGTHYVELINTGTFIPPLGKVRGTFVVPPSSE